MLLQVCKRYLLAEWLFRVQGDSIWCLRTKYSRLIMQNVWKITAHCYIVIIYVFNTWLYIYDYIFIYTLYVWYVCIVKFLRNPVVKNPLINFGSIHLKHFWVLEPLIRLKSLIETMDIQKNTCTFFSFQYFLHPSKSLAPTSYVKNLIWWLNKQIWTGVTFFSAYTLSSLK